MLHGMGIFPDTSRRICPLLTKKMRVNNPYIQRIWVYKSFFKRSASGFPLFPRNPQGFPSYTPPLRTLKGSNALVHATPQVVEVLPLVVQIRWLPRAAEQSWILPLLRRWGCQPPTFGSIRGTSWVNHPTRMSRDGSGWINGCIGSIGFFTYTYRWGYRVITHWS